MKFLLIAAGLMSMTGCAVLSSASSLSPNGTAPKPNLAETETMVDTNWQARFSPNLRYVNAAKTSVPVYAGASTGAKYLANIGPGLGGYIETCAMGTNWCKLQIEGPGQAGWVDMANFKGVPG